MFKTKKVLTVIFLAASINLLCGAAYPVTQINDLVENSIKYDNTEITVHGEAIGEILERGAYSWVNILDSTNSIGIWIKTEDAEKIKFFGDYKHKGDIVQIKGIFNRACSEHGGDVDIHCANIEIMQSGYIIQEKLSSTKIKIAIALMFLALTIICIFYKKTK